jgi:DNA-dependent RNA polymerase auxiliary subunit epsilon
MNSPDFKSAKNKINDKPNFNLEFITSMQGGKEDHS